MYLKCIENKHDNTNFTVGEIYTAWNSGSITTNWRLSTKKRQCY